jgi:hypothetical protein
MAHQGLVLDAEQQPIAGAAVCSLVPSTDTEGFCVYTDDKGSYVLPGTSIVRLRVRAEGYYPRIVAAEDRLKPVVMQKGAQILVHVQDSTGEPISDASVYVLTPDGRQRGRGYTNAAGVRIGPLPAGEMMIKATADGYLPGTSRVVRLVAGEETTIDVRLQTDPGQS